MGDVIPFRPKQPPAVPIPTPVGPGQSGMAPQSAWDRLKPKATADAIRALGEQLASREPANDPHNPAPRPMPSPTPSPWQPGQPWPRDPNAPVV